MTILSTAPAPTPSAPQRPAPAHPRWSIGHLPALDGLRGAAVAAVLLYHGGYLEGGYLGVDLFFVLSGFLITSLLLAEHGASGGIALGQFWLRRARRLLPALFVLVGGIALYAAIWARPIDLGDIRSSGVGALLYVANWQQIIHGTDYWDISLSPSPFQHVWSLAIEEQFYLVWPLVVLVLLRRHGAHPGRRVMRFSLVLSAVSATAFVLLHAAGASATRVYQGTDTRATAVLLGAALAGWRLERGPVEEHPRARQIEVAGLLAAGVLALAWLLLAGTSPLLYRGGLPLCSLLATVVVGAATSRTSPVLGRALSVRGLCFLGTISYGLYLWHWPVYLVLDEARTGRSGVALLAIRLLVSLAIALLSFRLVEQPIRRGAMRHRAARVLVPMVGVAMVGALLLATAGAVPPAAVNQVAAPSVAGSTIEGAPRLMVVGDSVANSVVGPMIDDPWSFGINPINQSTIGCQLMFKGHEVELGNGSRGSRPDCSAGYRAAVERHRPDLVLVFFGGANSGRVVIDGTATQPCDAAYVREQERLHADAIDDLRSTGAAVALVTLVPTDNTAVFRPPWNQNIACYNRTLRSIAEAQHVPLLDLESWICTAGSCRSEIDRSEIRPDGVHYNGPGGRAVARHLVDQGLELAGLRPAASAASVPRSCQGLRAAVGPLIDQVGGTSGPDRRSAMDRLKYVDLDAAAAAGPHAVAADILTLSARREEIMRVLRYTPYGTPLTLDRFTDAPAGAIDRLDRYLDATCTGR